MVTAADRLNNLMAQPEHVDTADLAILKETIDQHPYFQAARSLYLKGLKKENSPLYNKELQITASHTVDRTVLFDYITSAFFKQHEVSMQIKNQIDLLADIDVESEHVRAFETDLNKDLDYTQSDPIFEKKQEFTSQPLTFTAKEKHSFAEWLKLTSLKPIDRIQEEPNEVIEEDERAKRMERIELFLQEHPRIKPDKNQHFTGNLAKQNPAANQLMTETLAQVYLEQKNFSKAIQAYKILVLQHPEKSGFFADQIRKIKNLQSNN